MSRRTGDGLAFEVTGSGPPVLLIHAGIADRTMWAPQWSAWRERLTLIRYDQRGIGESADPAGDHSRHGDALAVLAAAGVDRAAVVGVSVGGLTAIDLALAAPERVTALVVVNAAPSGWQHTSDYSERFGEVDEAYERGGVDAANEAELRRWIDAGRAAGEVDPNVRQAVARMNREVLVREEQRERSGTEIGPIDLLPAAAARIGELEMPVLVVTGALDEPSMRAGAGAVAQHVGAELVEIAGAAHLPSLERPEQFARTVLPFLERYA